MWLAPLPNLPWNQLFLVHSVYLPGILGYYRTHHNGLETQYSCNRSLYDMLNIMINITINQKPHRKVPCPWTQYLLWGDCSNHCATLDPPQQNIPNLLSVTVDGDYTELAVEYILCDSFYNIIDQNSVTSLLIWFTITIASLLNKLEVSRWLFQENKHSVQSW